MGRHEVCVVLPGFINIWQIYCAGISCVPVLVGWMQISTTLRSKTWPHQGSWEITVQIRALSAEGDGLQGINISGQVGCEGECTPLSSSFPSQLLTVGQVVSGSGSVRTTIAGNGQKGVGHATMQLNINPVVPSIPGTHTQRIDPDTRCDTMVSTQVGCVFPQAGIVLDLSFDLYPSIAYHVESALGSGLVGNNVPLHRLMDPAKVAENRRIACNLRPPLDHSCDEYPFASTQEGAARWGEGAGRTFEGCQRPDLPTGVTGFEGWSACMVPRDDNDHQGGDMSEFYWRNHVIDWDDFYVETF